MQRPTVGACWAFEAVACHHDRFVEDKAKMLTCDKTAAAFHEVGHAATSLALGCQVKELALFWNGERLRWEGKYHHVHVTATSFFEEPTRLEKDSKVAVAGVLAQAKYQGSCQVGRPLRFDTSMDLADFVQFLRDRTRTEERPGSFVLAFLEEPGTTAHRFEYEGCTFSGADHRAFNSALAQVAGLSAEELIRETMALLDDPRGWRLAGGLASALDGKPGAGPDQRRTLSQDEIRKVYRREYQDQRV